ncbi:MAG TPA: DHA2 family efflux MFS transporter permease subunit [Acidimicrobiales bacterium]|nr:DHA2 family efflux MFS transporter permease subunit [Acidimicrobiales bacterium]
MEGVTTRGGPPAGDGGGLAFSSGRGRWVVAATALGSGIASLDATVVGIALPHIARTFHSGLGTLQWVVTGYALTLSAFLLLGGSLGDRSGRRRLFCIGVVWFAGSSVLCGVAPSSSTLISARILQGIGGALLTPASLAILQGSFRPDDRARAIGAWSGLSGVATAAGPLVGGYLLAVASWRWVFFINIPVAAAVLAITVRHVPETRDPTATGDVDVVGAGFAVVFLAGVTYGLIQGPGDGWTNPVVLGSLVLGVTAGAAFVWTEMRIPQPMLPLSVFRSRQFTGANAVTFLVYGALGGALFLLPIELQIVSGYSALRAGLSLVPVTMLMLLFSARSGALAARIGPRLQMSLGPLVVGAGLALLTRTVNDRSFLTGVLPAVVVFGIGLAITVAPLTSTALSAAPAEHSGIASAVNNVVARAAGLFAVAVLPVAAGIAGTGSLRAARFSAGFHTAVLLAAALCAGGGLLAALTIRNREGSASLRIPRVHQRTYHCAVGMPPPR